MHPLQEEMKILEVEEIEYKKQCPVSGQQIRELTC